MPHLDWLRNFDRQPAYVAVNYQGRKIHQSRTGGCISILFFISVILISGFKISGMWNSQKVIFQTLIGKDSFDQLNLNDSNLRILIKNKNNMPILCSDIPDHKINILFTTQIKTQNGQIIKNQTHNMIPCSQDNATQIYFCVPESVAMTVSGRKDVVKTLENLDGSNNQMENISVFAIRVRQLVSQLQHKQLGGKEQQGQNYLQFYQSDKDSIVYQPIIPVIIFTNHVINQQKRDINQAIFDDQKRAFQSNQKLDPTSSNRVTLQFTFQIKKVQMKTDYSIMPTFISEYLARYFDAFNNTKSQYSWFYGQEFTTESFSKSDDLFVAYFKRSMYSNTYKRHFAKIDIVMAETFGLIGLISMLLFCTYRGYNNWVLQKQNIGQEKSIHLFDYYKHQAKAFCFFISNHLISCLQFFKCYNCLKWMKDKLCCCLFTKSLIEQRNQSFLKKRGLQEQLDIYKSRRQINYLKKRVAILELALRKVAEHFSDVKLELDKSIRLSQGYQMTDSLITGYMEDPSKPNLQNALDQKFIGQK